MIVVVQKIILSLFIFIIYYLSSSIPKRRAHLPIRVSMKFRIHGNFVYFMFLYTIRKWSKFREIKQNFVHNLQEIPHLFRKIPWPLLYEIFQKIFYFLFWTIKHCQHFLHAVDKLWEADWGWGTFGTWWQHTAGQLLDFWHFRTVYKIKNIWNMPNSVLAKFPKLCTPN